MKYIIHFTLIAGMLLCCACSEKNKYEKRLELALKCGKENRQELEKVLRMYENDPEKLAAARFLIENMPYHSSLEQYYLSPEKEKYRPDIACFDGFQSVKNHCDSLERVGYEVITIDKPDISTLDSSFLVDNIELAFAVRHKPWVRNVGFEEFCRYILPYRAQSEKASNLRREALERFLPILDSAQVKTPLEACTILNERLKGVMKYGKTGLPFYPTTEETYRSGIGQCEGLCDLGILIMRACGIPVTTDQTIWTKMDLGHNWCAVLDNGKFYSFGPGEKHPGEHARSFTEIRHLHPAKVYRSRFDPDFSNTEKHDDGYFTHLKNPLLYDVTTEYLDKTTHIRVAINKKNKEKGKSDQVYLCTYNDYEWIPISIGQRKDSICYFEDVVGDNILMVADSPEGNELRYITEPFYVDKDGKINKLIPQKEMLETFTFNKTKDSSGPEQTLYYWDTDKEGFTSLEYRSSTDSTQTYDQIPGNALLWFIIPERIVNQRIFFLKNDSIQSY